MQIIRTLIWIVITIVLSPDLKRYEGKTLSEVAKERSTTPAAALVDLVITDGGATQVIRFLASEFDLQLALRQPWVSIGVDASADAPDGPLGPEATHPRAFGSMARLLGHYVREEKLFPLEEAVRKVTSLPARRLGLLDRGLLRPGMIADVVVFDPAKVNDVATYERPKQFPEGIATVVVNGEPVLVDGVRTEARPGRALLHPIPDGLR